MNFEGIPVYIYFFPKLDAILMVADPMPPNNGAVGWHIMGYWGAWISIFINPFIYFITNDFYETATIKTFGNTSFIYHSLNRNTRVAKQEQRFCSGQGLRQSTISQGRIKIDDVEMESQDTIL